VLQVKGQKCHDQSTSTPAAQSVLSRIHRGDNNRTQRLSLRKRRVRQSLPSHTPMCRPSVSCDWESDRCFRKSRQPFNSNRSLALTSEKIMNSSLLRKFAMPALLLSSLLVTACAGMHAGPGTTTGAVIGGAASVLNGERPVEIETHRGDRHYPKASEMERRRLAFKSSSL
jgi:hypothetical protein